MPVGGQDFFFFPIFFFFYKLECTGGEKKKKKFLKFQSALFSPPGRWTGNNYLFKGGLRPLFCEDDGF